MTRSTAPAPAPPDHPLRRAALPAVVLAAVIVTLVVPLSFPAGGGSTGADLLLERNIHAVLDAHTWVYRVLVFPSQQLRGAAPARRLGRLVRLPAAVVGGGVRTGRARAGGGGE
ncbi:hypothetical protein [Nocardia seriolae]|uniref:hypothetical protein n=1 Tax=Nocardia seriolae TaxID=37332 RepID=UPI0018AD24F9|nr:hypothetical protein [Nocardia seriolae]